MGDDVTPNDGERLDATELDDAVDAWLQGRACWKGQRVVTDGESLYADGIVIAVRVDGSDVDTVGKIGRPYVVNNSAVNPATTQAASAILDKVNPPAVWKVHGLPPQSTADDLLDKAKRLRDPEAQTVADVGTLDV